MKSGKKRELQILYPIMMGERWFNPSLYFYKTNDWTLGIIFIYRKKLLFEMIQLRKNLL